MNELCTPRPAVSANLLVLGFVAFLLAGCGSQHPAPSILQRFQALSSDLHLVTSTSGLLVVRAVAVDHAMRQQDWWLAKKNAVSLKHDALTLEAGSGESAAAIRNLLAGHNGSTVKKYFQLLLATLQYQWAEAFDVSLVSDLVWQDPLMITTGDSARLQELDGRARLLARKAVDSAAASSSWKRRNQRLFRYIPVRFPAAGRNGAEGRAGG